MYGARAALYDAIYQWKDYRAEAERLRALLGAEGVREGGRILEAACGTGAHLVHLREWYEVAGFDLSEGMLEIARGKLAGVPLFRADMADFALAEPADALLCLFSSIGYVYFEDRLRAAAAAFARAVRPGGALVVEPWITEEDYAPGRLTMQTVDGEDLKLCRAVVANRRGALTVLDFHWLVLRAGAPDAEHFVEHHELWMCPRATLLGALEEAGFDVRWEPGGSSKDRGLVIGRRR